MKKSLALPLTLLAFSVMNANASQEIIAIGKATPIKSKPYASLSVIEGEQVFDKNTVSIGKKQTLCLVIGNIVANEKNTLTQHFQAPKKTSIHITRRGVTALPDPNQGDNTKNFTITSFITANEVIDGKVAFCWGFDKTDPVGAYKLDVQFNNVEFKNLTFNVTK